MKKLLAAMFLMISATSFGQYEHINNSAQIWNFTPQYSSGGYNKLILNATTNRMEYTPNTFLSGKVVAVTETDSARNYNLTGAALCIIKWATRDTINLVKANYVSGQILRMVVIASGADTTVFVPSSGTVNAATTYTLTGTNNSISWLFDGTNYWILK